MSALPQDLRLEPRLEPPHPDLSSAPPAVPVELSEPVATEPRTRIVTGIKGHDFEGSPAVQSKAALTEDGVLFLAEGARADVLVRSYIAALDRRAELSEGKITPYSEIRTVPYTEIQQLYAESAEVGSISLSAGSRTNEESQAVAIIVEAVKERASDIFIEVYEDSAEVQYRIVGDIERRFTIKPERAKQLIRTVYDSMCEATSDPAYDYNRDQGGRIARKHIEGLGLHRIRVSTGPTDEERPLMTMRLHYDFGEPQSLVNLGYRPEHEAQFLEFTNFSYGIALISGPTGSGKSTSLANFIGYLQERDNCARKVITLEDPPEIRIPGTVQKAVLRKGLDRQAEGEAWIAGFDTLMRWNPDWIVAGELRLRETMDAALKSALTNHLTWGMLHASTATLVPTRLQEAGIEIGYLCDPEIFRLFANQSLVPQVCPHCSIPYAKGQHSLSQGLRERIETHCTPDTVRLRGPGCEHCYRGALRDRTICAEVLATDRALLNEYRNHGEGAMRRLWVRERGGMTKATHMIDKINTGQISPTDAERMVLPLDADAHLLE